MRVHRRQILVVLVVGRVVDVCLPTGNQALGLADKTTGGIPGRPEEVLHHSLLSAEHLAGETVYVTFGCTARR